MNFKKSNLAFLIVFQLFPFLAIGQEMEREAEQIIESAAALTDETFDYSELTERLGHYLKNPIDINKATREQLQELIFLNYLQINNLLQHINQNGLIVDLLELQSIEGFDSETIRKLLPFITLHAGPLLQNISLKKIVSKGGHDLIFRYGEILEKQRGFLISDTSKSRYLGTPQRLLVRYRYNLQNKLTAGLTMTKDAGEAFFYGAQKNGFDFYSGFVTIQNTGSLKKVVLGDYTLQFGQGLNMWAGLSFGKGPDVAFLAKKDIGLRPYSSTNESAFLRGASATIVLNRLSFTPFVSYRFLDGRLSEDGGGVSSVSQTGFHRTPNEAAHKNSIDQLIYGSSAEYAYKGLRLGSVVYKTRFSHTFQPGSFLYNQFNFAGSSLTNAGLYYSYHWKNTYLFGEAAQSVGSGMAYLAGLMTSLSKRLSLVTLHRNYAKDYHSFFNQALAESSSAVNEKGFYSGVIISPSSRIEISAYTDVFRFPWLKYRVDAPSKGHEALMQMVYTPNKQLKAWFRLKVESKEENSSENDIVSHLQEVFKQNYRGEFQYKINSSIQLRNRIELIRYQKGSYAAEYGFLMYHDITYHPLSSRLSGNARFTIFDTDSYNSRIYTYENDVLYGYAIPAFQNRGIRFYLNGRCRIKRGIDFWLKYGVTRYTGTEEIGSGLDLIQGNRKSEIRAQIRLQY